jgi:hypothetical protein
MAMTQKQLEYQREYRKNNPEMYKKHQKQTIKSRNRKMVEDLDFFIDFTYKSLKNGAEARGYAFNLNKTQLRHLVETNTHCALSGRKLTRQPGCPNKLSIDRIDNRYGYSMKNVRVVTQQVNIHRLDSTTEDFVRLARDIAKYSKKFKC